MKDGDLEDGRIGLQKKTFELWMGCVSLAVAYEFSRTFPEVDKVSSRLLLGTWKRGTSLAYAFTPARGWTSTCSLSHPTSLFASIRTCSSQCISSCSSLELHSTPGIPRAEAICTRCHDNNVEAGYANAERCEAVQ